MWCSVPVVAEVHSSVCPGAPWYSSQRILKPKSVSLETEVNIHPTKMQRPRFVNKQGAVRKSARCSHVFHRYIYFDLKRCWLLYQRSPLHRAVQTSVIISTHSQNVLYLCSFDTKTSLIWNWCRSRPFSTAAITQPAASLFQFMPDLCWAGGAPAIGLYLW